MEKYFDLKLLEFDKIIEKIKKYAVLDETLDTLSSLFPYEDDLLIIKALKETSDMLEIIKYYGSIDFIPYKLSNVLPRIRIKAPLEIVDFLELIKLSTNVYKMLGLLKKSKANIELSSLPNYLDTLTNLIDMENAIRNIMDPTGEIFDSASPLLHSLRKSLRIEESNLDSKFASILRSEGDKLSDQIITIRNGRRVIPVKSEYKSHIKGIFHGTSASGLTSFIEPFAIIEIENKIEDIKDKINKEISRILFELSLKVAEYYPIIQSDYDIINYFDFLSSKAEYAKEIYAVMPNVGDNTELIQARHPLIDPEKIVPNDIRINLGTSMIITGPNTGGKTVVLKTLGLLTLMAKSGILIPVKEGSTIALPKNVFADLGDEQSIEQSLSTFSSHMTKIIYIINHLEEKSLVLIDELGAGTDPVEGSSLAKAIINYLKKTKIYLVVSTHYSSLKIYAYNTKDVVNASVEFDEESLKPTYKLLIGIPGSSNAIIISKRLGLDESIIKDAEISEEDKTDIEKTIKKIEDESLALKNVKEEYELKLSDLNKVIARTNEELAEKRRKINKEIDDLEANKTKILIKTQRSANKILDEIEELKEEIKKSNKYKENEIVDAKAKISSLYESKELVKKTSNSKELKVGDKVNIVAFSKTGFLTGIKNGKYYVSFGNMNSSFKKEELEYVPNEDEKPITYSSLQSVKVQTDVKTRLDLRGKRYEEALSMLDQFLDDAILTGVDKVTIIHGFGSLALRNMTIDYAKTHSQIKNYRSGDAHEGGNGVTILYLK